MSKAVVIDDSRAVRMILSKMLVEMGYEVCQAANGREALTVVAQLSEAPALVLVDWNMPEMNGLEFVKQFRANSSFSATPLVMVTTETEVGQVSHALDAGANEYIMKPFTKDVIADKLRLVGATQ